MALGVTGLPLWYVRNVYLCDKVDTGGPQQVRLVGQREPIRLDVLALGVLRATVPSPIRPRHPAREDSRATTPLRA